MSRTTAPSSGPASSPIRSTFLATAAGRPPPNCSVGWVDRQSREVDSMRTAPEVGANLAGQFRISALRLLRRLRSEHTPDTPSGVQFSALVCLSRHGGLTPRELEIREEIQKSTVTKLIAALQADGLISR